MIYGTIDKIVWTLIFTFLLIFLILVLHFLYMKRKISKIKQKISKIEKDSNSKVIFVVDEWWSSYYGKYVEYFDDYLVDINNSGQFQNILNKMRSREITTINICIQSKGGLISENDIIIHNLLNYEGKINTYVPKYALSAASMLALCGDNIYLYNTSVLGPTDPIVCVKQKSLSVYSLIKLKENKKINNISDDILLQIYESERYYYENLKLLKRICLKHKKNNNITDKNFAKKVLRNFGSGKWTHSTPFTKKFLESTGLNVRSTDEINDYSEILNDIFNAIHS
ncbi:serine dehydrogenase proteinase [Catovirus CTV1]|uniref:Serine dehydrogenase proteinase n=1 Tax=Catovirus CTV1 TaxID=1977631 RepID=A0A1V0SAV4_9VIRU|nr:serine dehydrogenase proteinase [Catovirus CTV1]